MHVAFLYIAEAYQSYHAAAVALALARRSGVTVEALYNDPETPRHLERIQLAHGEEPMPARELQKSLVTRMFQKVPILGMIKQRTMRENVASLERYDAVVSVENTAAALRGFGLKQPRLIYMTHGSGDRAKSFVDRIATFDFVLASGSKTANRFLENKLVQPGRFATPGYVKLDTVSRLGRLNGAPFDNDRPTVVYNSHCDQALGSWKRFIEPMIEAFAAQSEFNLIVAPHVKLFARKSSLERKVWNNRSSGNILIDTDSDRLIDGSYAAVADIYMGDVSSQLYEFLGEPKPCIFLNAHLPEWRDDANFEHWHLGQVVENPSRLMDAVRDAIPSHHRYRDRQRVRAAQTLGNTSPGAAERAADAIYNYLASADMIEQPTKELEAA